METGQERLAQGVTMWQGTGGRRAGAERVDLAGEGYGDGLA